MSTFIIRNKKSLEQWVAQSGKRSWNKPNHAKAAFANSRSEVKNDPLLKDYVKDLNRYESLKFNDQDVYKVVELYSDAEKVTAKNARKLKEIEDILGGDIFYYGKVDKNYNTMVELLEDIVSILEG